MSTKALGALIKEIVSTVDLKSFKYKVTGDTANKGARDSFNRVVHILYVNDRLLDTLAPEAINILKEANPDLSPVQAILTKYRQFRGKAGRIRSYKDPSSGAYNPKTYRLIFDSFDSVRRFMNSLGLNGRPTFILQYFRDDVNGDATTLRRLMAEIGEEVNLSTPQDILKALSALNPADKKAPLGGNPEANELYRRVYDTIDGFDVGHNTPVAYETVELFTHNTALMNELIKKVYAKLKLKSSYSGRITAVNKEIQALAASTIKDIIVKNNFVAEKNLNSVGGTISVFIESSKGNQEGASEVQILNAFQEAIALGIRKHLTNRDDSRILGQSGSKSIKDHILDTVVDTILTGEYKITGKAVSSRTRVTKTSVIKPTKPKVRSKGLVYPPKLPRLRNVRGQFTSLTSIEKLIRASLTRKIKENMRAPALVNRTGRFAESVELNRVERSPRGEELVAFLTYMKYPYATFELGGRQGSQRRDPRNLISSSVREIATEIVKQRMRVVIE